MSLQVEALPIRDELDELARRYHHLQNEHKRARPEGGTRRRLEEQLLEAREKFDRVLRDWVNDEDLRREWVEYLHHDRPEPSGPPPIQPVVFRGVSEVSGSVIEIRGKSDELKVWIDGSFVERIVGEKQFQATQPRFRFRLNGQEFLETFEVAPTTLQELADFLERGEAPPWEVGPELLTDGLIDIHFALTRRGRRALASLQAE